MQNTMAYTPLYIYLHTHWDREWFLPFSTARALLLDRVKKTLSALESGELPSFYLDGQAVVLEDLIEIEPQIAERIRTAMYQGLLSAGPWYVLPDQSLVCGESLIRNLKIGIDVTKRFGQPTLTGYNPDTFCHVQDLPRILNGFNIKTAVVLRGVPPLRDTNVFWWQSPDGSRVLTYWLNKGLSHTIFHTTTDVQQIASDLSSRWPLDTVNDAMPPMLYSCGGEGMQAPGDLTSKLNGLNRILPASCKAKVVPMEEFLNDLTKWARGKSLPELSGDLRDNSQINERFPAYVLDGVSSTRLYLKHANALAEHRLIRIAEPFFAMLHAAGVMPYPERELQYSWKLLLQNHPHDSICGCSIDPVHQEMMTRSQQLNSFLNGLDHVAMESLNEWNPLPLRSTSQPGVRLGIQTSPVKTSALPPAIGPQPIDPDSGSNRLLVFNTSGYTLSAPVWMTWYVKPSTVIVPSSKVQIETDALDTNHLFQTGGGFYYKHVRRIQGWIWPSEVPALGYSKRFFDGADLKLDTNDNQEAADARLVKEDSTWKVDNGLLRAEVDQHGNLVATQQQFGKPQKCRLGHHLYDVGDAGDSYNFDPLPDDKPLKAQLIRVSPGKQGPLVSSLILSYRLDIPEGIDPKTALPEQYNKRRRTKKLLRHTIQTEVSIRKGVPILFFETNWENRSCDHRLEVRFNSARTVKDSWAECHFSMSKRLPVVKHDKLPVKEGHEIPPQSQFCQRFFIAGDQIFFNRGLPEYRMEDNYIAITLLRAVSYLSRGRLRTRGGGAGPWDATPEANCLGINHCQYGWSFLAMPNSSEKVIANKKRNKSSLRAPQPFHNVDNSAKLESIGDASSSEISSSTKPNNEQISQAYRLVDLFEGRLVPFAVGTFEAAHSRSFIDISNPALYITATYMETTGLLLRILNTSFSQQSARIYVAFPFCSAGKVNFLGEDFESLPLKRVSSDAMIIDMDFKENELLTIKFDL